MSTSAPSSSSSETGWAGSAEEWTERVFDATLDSGMKVSFRLVSLAEMAQLGELPDELRELAWREWAEPGVAARLVAAPYNQLGDKPTKKQRSAADAATAAALERIVAVNRHLIAFALVEPKMTVEQLERVPFRDLERLSILVNRGSGVDAQGRHVGVVPLETFQVALAAHGHERCPADCEACEVARRALSQVRG